MALPFLFVSAIVPSLLLIWFFHGRDLYPEPQRVVWATFGLGVLTILPAVLVELAVDAGLKQIGDPFLEGWLEAFLSAALTEESLKYAVVVLYCMRHVEFDEPMDGIVYGAIASLGFATLENCIYVGEAGGGAAIFRAFTAVPGHACMGAIMGYFVGQAKFTPAKRRTLLAKAFFIPLLLHGLYDGPLLSFTRYAAHKHHGADPMEVAGPFLVVTLGTLVFEVVWTLILSGRLRREQKGWMATQWAAYNARRPPPAPPWALAPEARAQPFAPRAHLQPTLQSYVQPVFPVQTEVVQSVWAPKTEQMLAPPVHTEAPRQAYPQTYPRQDPQAYPEGPVVYPPQAAPPQLPPGHQPYAQHAPADVVAWLMVTFGALFASGGGLMVLGVVAALLTSSTKESRVVPLVIGGVIVGVFPLAIGALLFAFGIGRVARASVRPPPQSAAMAYGR